MSLVPTSAPELFPSGHAVGVFKGLREGGLEFHAELVLPYHPDFDEIPMLGRFVLVQLETADAALLGRITAYSPDGRLSWGAGEEFNISAVQEGRPVPEDLREDYIRYRIDVRMLGVLRRTPDGLSFVASHRRLPHVGSRVAFPTPEVLREIIGHGAEGAPIGHFALGEYVYAGDSDQGENPSWMQVLAPEILSRFPVSALVSRRSFVFARAGFGKSNLTKLLFSTLYAGTPQYATSDGREHPVGTIIFDPEGEYFWPDAHGRPGLADVPALEDKLVLFTDRHHSSPFYESFKVGGAKVDLRRLKPADVISIGVAPDRQDQQNVAKLRGLQPSKWIALVDLIYAKRFDAPGDEIASLLSLGSDRGAEVNAARSNMTRVVSELHDPSSTLLDGLVAGLAAGKMCVVDISQLSGGQSMMLAGLILRKIFEHNQEQFTLANPRPFPTIAVLEEAQSVLNDKGSAATPFIEWVKEGRKYGLGSVMITQQPGSIGSEILSQGDNWFVFHLLSADDLHTLRRANAHFSEDILAALLNEPIPGQGTFWSSAASRPYPIAFRALSFEQMFAVRDPHGTLGPGNTFAASLSLPEGGEDAFPTACARAIKAFLSRLNLVKTIVWNMASKSSNWAVLRESPELQGADLSLVCEATPAPPDIQSVGLGATVGLEAPLLPDKPVKRPWSTAVASLHPVATITDARVDRSYGEPLPFEPSRPGSWTAASVEVDGVRITAISFYGLLDEKSDASVHRSLSELSPIFDHDDYGKRLLLGGDLNILAGQPKGERLNRSQVVLERIAAYGLVDCLAQVREPGALEGCKCDLGAGCTHTWTKFDPKRPTIPYQDDYLFASKSLASRLDSCEALSPRDWYDRSDHAPIVATFGL